MKTQSIINRLRAEGYRITQKRTTWTARGERHQITWYDQDGIAVCLRVAGDRDHDDPQGDYTAGDYVKTIKAAIEYGHNYTSGRLG